MTWIKVHTVAVSGRGLTMELERTKVTGAGKAVESLLAYVATGPYLVKPDWLVTGHLLWTQLLGEGRFVVGFPSSDRESMLQVAAVYHDLSKVSKALLASLDGVALVSDDFVFDKTGKLFGGNSFTLYTLFGSLGSCTRDSHANRSESSGSVGLTCLSKLCADKSEHLRKSAEHCREKAPGRLGRPRSSS